jgi:hypothetical protein
MFWALKAVKARIPTLSAVFENRPLSERLRSYRFFRASRPGVRRSEAAALARLAQVEGAFVIGKDQGVGPVVLDRALVAECVADAKQRLEAMKAAVSERKNRKNYLQQLTTLADYDVDSAPFKLATNEKLVKAVADYLGAAPVLWDITAMYSPPASEGGALRGSQYWHRDGDDVTNVKVWVLCSDVSLKNGPTLCLPKAVSDKIADEIAYKQSDKLLDDRVIDPYLSDVFTLVGKSGDTFVTDTSRCFHMGSRTTADSERLVLMFHYVSRYAIYFWPWFRSKTSRSINPQVRDLSAIQKDLIFPFH